MADSPRVLSSKVRIEGLFETCLFLGLLGSWLGLLGQWHWFLDLFSHFRLQYALAAALALPWALWRQRRILTWIAVATLLLNVWLIARTDWDVGGGIPADDFKIRVVSFNVLSSNENHEGVLKWLQQADADVLFLMEVDNTWAKDLQPLTATHPHHVVAPRADNFGLALYSRLPLEEVQVLSATDLPLEATTDPDALTEFIRARLKIADHEFLLLGAHPVPPIGRDYAASRDEQLTSFRRYIAKAALPTLIAGDLNASPWSSGYQFLADDSALRPAPRSWAPTWRRYSPVMIPIDHALCSPPLVFKERTLGPDLGSDHRPQILDLGWAEPRL
ncbi:MAG: endonuclease/exonuclease/phosphatase family protein [Verrucomicrobiales bacterium]|nr:endonuclease/exonuclease/phosphatase family protein [Verrucomicrobiales bacterium]MCP5558885.1 endonuclease/exonuclease/phosphatase family protein [Verrucomicrobiaceae bacterium]